MVSNKVFICPYYTIFLLSKTKATASIISIVDIADIIKILNNNITCPKLMTFNCNSSNRIYYVCKTKMPITIRK